MRGSRLSLALASAVTVILGGCSGTSEVTLTEADSTTEVSVDSGARIVVRLESNPATGYEWQVDEMTTPGLVELESQEFEPPTDESGDEDQQVVGAPGTAVFTFTAGDRGAGILRLIYIRAFDDLPIPERVVEYIIRTDGAPWPPDDVGTDPPATVTETAPTDSSDD